MAIIGIVWASMILLTGLVVVVLISQVEAATWRTRQQEAAQGAAGAVASFYNHALDYLWFLGSFNPADLRQNPNLISRTLAYDQALMEMLVLDGQGNIIAHVASETSVFASPEAIPQSEWYLQARQGIRYNGAVQYTESKQPYIVVALRMQNDNIVAGCLNLNALWPIVDQIHFGASGRVHILDHQGNIITRADAAQGNATVVANIASRPEFNAIISAPNHTWYGEYTDYEGDAVASASMDIPATDWIIVTEAPWDEVYAASRLAGVTVLAGMLLLGTVGQFIARRLVRESAIRPIESLRDSAIRIGQGDLLHRSTISNLDEVGAVALAFNEMTQRLSDQRDVMARRNAEMEALAAANAQLYERAQVELAARKQVEQELRQARDELEVRVSERTAELRVANQQMQVELHERKRVEQRLIHDALHDYLTGLPNRVLFSDRLSLALNRTKRGVGGLTVVLYLDLDRFKMINDSFGHSVGDQLLIEVGQRITANVRAIDTVARMSGDEFGILLNGVCDMNEVISIINRLQLLLREINIETHQARPARHVFTLSASIGIVPVTAGYEQPDDIMRDADTAMYRAKANGNRRHEIFDVAMHNSVFSQLQMEMELRRGIENHEFEAYYQPIVSVVDGRISSVEALMRWRHPDRGLLAPDLFIPAAEESGLIAAMEEQVLRMACAQTVQWRQNGYPNLAVSVNFSAPQFQEEKLMSLVLDALAESGLPASALKLELTESVAMSNPEYNLKVLADLNDAGVEVMLDDFGSSYSWLGYLKRLPLRVLKIDRSFIKDMIEDDNSDALVRAIVAMAHSLRMGVVAEGVETEQQLERVTYHGVDAVQGYLISKPVPPEMLPAVIQREPFWAPKDIDRPQASLAQ